MAMIFQEPMTSLNPVFTVEDQIGEAITVHEDIGQEELRRRCIQLLKDVGIPSPEQRLKDYPHQLSGGQRQRVMIAMALACNPDLVIADEPTTALDVTIQAQILSLFRELKKKRELSLLYITHDLGVVSTIADRVYVMYAGIIAEQGNTDHIFREPKHPYTQSLLASLPSRAKRGKALYSIPGTCRTRPISRRDVLSIPDVLTPSILAEAFIRHYVIMEEDTSAAVLSCMNERTPAMEKSNQRTPALLRVEGLQKYFPVRRGFFKRSSAG